MDPESVPESVPESTLFRFTKAQQNMIRCIFTKSNKPLKFTILEFAKENLGFCRNLEFWDFIIIALLLHQAGYTVIFYNLSLMQLGFEHQLEFNHQCWTPTIFITLEGCHDPSVEFYADAGPEAYPLAVECHGSNVEFHSKRIAQRIFEQMIKYTPLWRYYRRCA